VEVEDRLWIELICFKIGAGCGAVGTRQ